MLQQTQVQTVIPYFERFLAQWPDIAALATATEEEVQSAWAGLGYYSRARQLHKLAGIVSESYGGIVPSEPELLATLPGIGPYSSGAIASIAFGRVTPAIDGNVIRVFSRLLTVDWGLDSAKDRKALDPILRPLIPKDAAGDFNEALMDLGATICTPKNPRCSHCPISDLCEAHRLGETQNYPLRKPTKAKVREDFYALLLLYEGKVLLFPRSERLLNGFYLPILINSELSLDDIEARYACHSLKELEEVDVVFTHKTWHLKLLLGEVNSELVKTELPAELSSAVFCDRDKCAQLPLPGFMQKCLEKHIRSLLC